MFNAGMALVNTQSMTVLIKEYALLVTSYVLMSTIVFMVLPQPHVLLQLLINAIIQKLILLATLVLSIMD
jgi:hypothetical protein